MRKCFKSEHCSVLLGSRHLFYRCDNAITYHRYRDLLKVEICLPPSSQTRVLTQYLVVLRQLTVFCPGNGVTVQIVAILPEPTSIQILLFPVDVIILQNFLCNHSIIDECTLQIQIPKCFTNFMIRIFSPSDPDPIFYLF